jgi:hypothetical protein
MKSNPELDHKSGASAETAPDLGGEGALGFVLLTNTRWRLGIYTDVTWQFTA